MRGVIFDFNGTMFFDSDKHETAWRIFLKKAIHRDVTDWEFKEYVHGRNNSFILEYFFNGKLPFVDMEKMVEEKESIYRKLCLEDIGHLKLVDGLTDFLNYLQDNNISFTIATAAGEKNVKFYFKHLELERWFNLKKIVYDDGTLPSKPNPAIYIRAIKAIGLEPKKCIVFEDAKSGILAAKNAGVRRIVVVSSSNREESLLDFETQITIKDYSDLKLLKGLLSENLEPVNNFL